MPRAFRSECRGLDTARVWHAAAAGVAAHAAVAGVAEWHVGDGTAGARHQVAAGIVLRDAQVLLCHRSPDRVWYPDVWDLPGGHVAIGETPRHALARELREELGIAITVPAEPEFARLMAPDFDCRLWVITEWVGTPSNMAPHEHDDVAWWSWPAIDGLRLAHEDYPALIRRALT
jgi:8-oxo-dGTP diphosphatase